MRPTARIAACGALARNRAPRDEPGRVDLAPQVEVRNLLPALGRVTGHRAPDGTDLRRDAACCFDVRGDDGAVRSAAAQARDVDAAFLCKPAGLGRCERSLAVAPSRRRAPFDP